MKILSQTGARPLVCEALDRTDVHLPRGRGAARREGRAHGEQKAALLERARAAITLEAVFTEAEVEQLISTPVIAVHRRVAYALEFLTGLRTGQVSALRWGDYEPDMKPLGRLVSALSYDSKRKLVKATKTGVTHEVPVHPTLARYWPTGS